MTELHWNLGWTLVTLGVCWLALSCVVALALGQIIKRSKTSSDSEQTMSGVLPESAPVAFEMDEQLDDDGLPAQGYGSRAASGTRLRAVQLEQDSDRPARKVS
jgi:hypothetical protein